MDFSCVFFDDLFVLFLKNEMSSLTAISFDALSFNAFYFPLCRTINWLRCIVNVYAASELSFRSTNNAI